MSDGTMTAKEARQLRGLLLELVYLNHNRQRKRLSSTVLLGTLTREGYAFSKNDVRTMLQDLNDRGYIRYMQMRDDDSAIFIFEIQITASGRDLCDGLRADPAVQTQ